MPSPLASRSRRRASPPANSWAWQPSATSGRFLLAAAMLVVALLCGGGGSPAPRAELIVELAAIVLLCASLWAGAPVAAGRNPVDWPVIAGALCLVAVPALQLVPLPPAIWQALPGRTLEMQALQLVGAEGSWRPLSLLPFRTFASLLSLLPPLAMLLFVSRLTVEERSALLPIVAALGCVSALLGTLQLAAGESATFYVYAQYNAGFLNGFQANRNQEADILLVAILAAAAAAGRRGDVFRTTTARGALLLVLLLLACAVVLTGSRAGIGLLPVAAAGAYLLLGWGSSGGRRYLLGAAAAVLLLGGLALLSDNAVLNHSFKRFGASREARISDIWPDALFALRAYWPAGAGVGTFIPVFQIGERLEVVSQAVANRAHNDYLEFAIEAGVAGVAVMALLLVGAAVRVAAILLSGDQPERRGHTLFALFAGVVLALHSLVDYPMRSMSLAVVAGMAVGLLSRVARSRADRDARD